MIKACLLLYSGDKSQLERLKTWKVDKKQEAHMLIKYMTLLR